MTHNHVAYFGYGSLVNRATHRTRIAGFATARLNGWRRQWLPRSDNDFGGAGPIALLSVVRDPHSEIDGLVVRDHAHNLAAVDARENHYEREILPENDLHFLNGGDGEKIPVNIYVARPVAAVEIPGECRILRSYLDAVMQGYLKKFGLEGLHRFVHSTNNFEVGIREDRNNPLYPRSVDTSAEERALFDRLAPPGK